MVSYNSSLWSKCSRWPRVKLSTFNQYIRIVSQPYKFCDSLHGLSWSRFYLIEIQRSIIFKIWSGQSYFYSHTDFTNTWWYLEIFHHYIRNIGSPAPKHSELLASHRGDLRSEGYLYSYSSRATFGSRVFCSWPNLV